VSRFEVKVCGVTSAAELAALAEARVDYAGLWFDVASGRHSLTRDAFHALSRRRWRGLRLVAVTTQSDPDAVAAFVCGAPIAAVQVHGFMLPGALQRLRGLLDDAVEIFKVLHFKDGRCLERPLVRAYSDAGADAFVVDNFESRERIGSTGIAVPLAAVSEVAESVGAHRVFLAGGVDAARIREVGARLGVRGFDVDSAARVGGRIERARVLALVAAGRGARPREVEHAR
jgi:phosphoribosylanthranilate isomerase